MKTPIVQYDREANMILLHPMLINVLKLLGWLLLIVFLAPIMFVYLLIGQKK